MLDVNKGWTFAARSEKDAETFTRYAKFNQRRQRRSHDRVIMLAMVVVTLVGWGIWELVAG